RAPAVAGAPAKEVLQGGELAGDRGLARLPGEAREKGPDAVHVDVGERRAPRREERRQLPEVRAVPFDGMGRGVRLVPQIRLELLDQSGRRVVHHASARESYGALASTAWYQSRRRCRNARARRSSRC